MVKKGKKKKKTLRRIGVYFLSLLCFYILAAIIYPVDDDNTLVLPNWYYYVMAFVPIIIAVFYDKLHLTQKLINAMHKKQSTEKSANSNFPAELNAKTKPTAPICDAPSNLFQNGNDYVEPQGDLHGEKVHESKRLLNNKMVVPGRSDIAELYYTEAGQERVKVLSKKVKESAITVNSTIKPDKFFDTLNYLIDCLLDLQQYEKYGIFGSPTPSKYLISIMDGLEQMVDSFITRALEQDQIERLNILDPQESYRHHEKFMIALISAFDCSNSFWSGDKVSPHYIGPLYTQANYDRVQKIYDQLDDEYDKVFILPAIQEKSKAKEPNEPEKLSYADKERIMVERIQQGDMEQFANIPYDLTGTIHKITGEHTHAFAYMNLNQHNISIAKEHIMLLNRIIDRHRADIPLLEKKYFIDTNKIAFAEYSKAYGYSKFICTPYTFTREVSKVPLELQFMTDLSKKTYSANGTIRYGVDGEIKSAEASIWYKPKISEPGSGWIFSFRIINGILELERAKSTFSPDKYGMPADVYKDISIRLEDQQREKDYADYLWIEKNLPTLCPKSLTGFRRMRTMNTKNYQKIVVEAAKLGKEI